MVVVARGIVMRIDLPDKVKELNKIFVKNRYELYAVGGVVRDSLLGLQTSDIDFCTSATPDEMLAMFPYAIKTGIKHGTLTIPFKKEHYEITTYRIDGTYSDSRHPENVAFSKNLKEDLSRRDFTINAMAADIESGEVVDLFLGTNDIKNKIVRTVGNPEERFKEDALRMMRAVRFSSRLGFSIEDKTFEAMKSLSKTIENISKERIKTELFGILESAFVKDGIKNLITTGLWKGVFPYLNPPQFTAIDALDINGKGKAYLRFVEILYITRATIESATKSIDFLKCSNKEKDEILHLYKAALVDIHSMKTPYRKRNFLSLLNREFFDDFFLLLNELNSSSKNDKEKYAPLLSSPLTIKELAVNGNDLKTIGISDKEIGNTLKKCLTLVLENPEDNTKEKLLSLLQAKA